MKNVKKTNKFLLIAIVVFAVICMYIIPIGLGVWAVINDINSSKYEVQGNEILINKGNLKMTNITSYYDSDEKIYYIEGLLRNNQNKKYEYIDITFLVYDGSNNILGEATTNLSVLEENGTWRFKAKYFEKDAEEVSSYKFSSIELY